VTLQSIRVPPPVCIDLKKKGKERKNDKKKKEKRFFRYELSPLRREYDVRGQLLFLNPCAFRIFLKKKDINEQGENQWYVRVYS
jgi:hypothetical protein